MELTRTRAQENRAEVEKLNEYIAVACDNFYKLTGLRVVDTDVWYNEDVNGKAVYHKCYVKLE